MLTIEDMEAFGHPWFAVAEMPFHFARMTLETSQKMSDTMRKVSSDMARATGEAGATMSEAAQAAAGDFTKRVTDLTEQVGTSFTKSFGELMDVQRRVFEHMYMMDPKAAEQAMAIALEELNKLGISMRKQKEKV